MIEVGNLAPDFMLKDHNGKEFQLSEIKGKKVLLSFHPLAWTGVCRDQMLSLENNYDRFSGLNTIPLGISVDSVPSKKAWAVDMDTKNTSLLSDFCPQGAVAKLFGAFIEERCIAGRCNIIVDENQKVVFAKSYPISELPDIEEIFNFLKSA